MPRLVRSKLVDDFHRVSVYDKDFIDLVGSWFMDSHHDVPMCRSKWISSHGLVPATENLQAFLVDICRQE